MGVFQTIHSHIMHINVTLIPFHLMQCYYLVPTLHEYNLEMNNYGMIIYFFKLC